MELDHLETIRLVELERVLDELKCETYDSKDVLLEIGAGSGWQAKKMAESGYSVKAIDLEDSNYSMNRIWPISDYDGKKIPFTDRYFDIIFSSNVLEHIPHLEAFQFEIDRVLKSNGVVIHVVPSGSWRFWSNIAHYPYLFKTVARIIYSKTIHVAGKKNDDEMDGSVATKIKTVSKAELMKKALFPPRHGERGNALEEIYYFSKRKWFALFEKTGWKVKKYSTNNLFYTGYAIFGSAMPIRVRKLLSHFLGSSCHVFILTRIDSETKT